MGVPSSGGYWVGSEKTVLGAASPGGESCDVWSSHPLLDRQTGLGLTALIGRLGASLAPLAALLDGVWLMLPKLAYGGIALLAACTALLLPETKMAQLPETIQDVERKRYMCTCVQIMGSNA